MKIKVTEATINDSSKIGAIAYSVAELHYRKTEKEFKKPTLKSQIGYICKCISDENTLILKAQVEDKIVGYAVIYFNKFPTEYFQFNKRAFIGSMGVDENYHHQGVGKALLKGIEKEVKKHKISIIEVDYYIFNKAAERLYKTVGYMEKKRYMSKFI